MTEIKRMAKRRVWHFAEDGFILEGHNDIISFTVEGKAVFFHIDEIDNVIDALKRARSYYIAKKLAEKQTEALARWGQKRIPTDV
jgi:hypothetical protein